jgi:hypothetical protein
MRCDQTLRRDESISNAQGFIQEGNAVLHLLGPTKSTMATQISSFSFTTTPNFEVRSMP